MNVLSSRREGVVRERVVKKDVVTVLGQNSMPSGSSSSASEGGFNNDFEDSQEEEEAAETVESKGGEEKEEDEEKLSGQEREVGSGSARVVERVGLVGRRNSDAKRKRRVQKGIGGQVYVGILMRGGWRRGGRGDTPHNLI